MKKQYLVKNAYGWGRTENLIEAITGAAIAGEDYTKDKKEQKQFKLKAQSNFEVYEVDSESDYNFDYDGVRKKGVRKPLKPVLVVIDGKIVSAKEVKAE